LRAWCRHPIPDPSASERPPTIAAPPPTKRPWPSLRRDTSLTIVSSRKRSIGCRSPA